MLALRELGYTALLIGVLVFVHELGHFLVAKLLGVKVLRFSIGFGPRIIGFTRGETEYQLAWVPLGGYVKMAGDVPGEVLPPEDAKRGFLTQAPWRRALIVAAGPAFNLAFPVLVYFLAFIGTRDVLSTRVARVEPGLPAATAGIQPGDRIVSIDGDEVQTFDELRSRLQNSFEREVAVTLERGGQRQVLRLTPTKGVEENPIEKISRGMIGVSPYLRVPLMGVPVGSAAEKAGFHTFDRITAVNDKAVANEPELYEAVRSAQGVLKVSVARGRPKEEQGAPLVIEVEKQAGEGFAALGAEEVDLYVSAIEPGSLAEGAGVKVGDKVLAFNGKPLRGQMLYDLALSANAEQPFQLTWRSGAEQKTAELKLAKREVKDELGQKSMVLDDGLDFGGYREGDFQPLIMKLTLSPGQALAASFQRVPEVIGKTAIVFARLFTGKVPFDALGGPIQIHKLTSKTVQLGMDYFLNLMAAISVSLGLMNLLPIPILDGFHLVAALWEGIRRRPIPVRAREVANMVGLAMLVVLMVLVFRNDLRR